MSQETLTVVAAAIVGGLIGLIADRLSVRWPAHEADYRAARDRLAHRSS